MGILAAVSSETGNQREWSNVSEVLKGRNWLPGIYPEEISEMKETFKLNKFITYRLAQEVLKEALLTDLGLHTENDF